MTQIPKLIATSVVRGSEKGQSHGGVYLLDFENQVAEQKIDWNTGDIDFAGRGWDRGLRGIEFTDAEIWIAASDELFCYDPEFRLIASYRNQYLRHCHEIYRRDNLLFLTSTGFDSLLTFDLESKSFNWGLYISRDGKKWLSQAFDPGTRRGPDFANSYHLNMVFVDADGIYFSGLNTSALLAVSAMLDIEEYCSLPRGCHNARPFRSGVLFNDTGANAVRYVDRDGSESVIPVPSFDPKSLTHVNLDDSKIARQRFGRGLCVIGDNLIAAGSSPSTVSIVDLDKKERVAVVNLTMDIRNAVHGLETWPTEWG